MMKQIIYIVAHSITTAESMSGGDKNFIELAKAWQKEDHQTIIITNPEGKKMCLQAGLRAKFIILPDINSQKYRTCLVYLYRLLTSIQIFKQPVRTNSQLIFSSSHYLTDILPAFFLKLKQKQSKWGIFLNLYFPNPLKGFTFAYQPGRQFPKLNQSLNWLFQFPSLFIAKYFADKVFCINQEIKNTLLKRKFSEKKLGLFVYGIDHRFIKKTKSPGPPIFDGLFIGRFHPQKGLSDLITIWQKVVKTIPKARLGIIGSGPKKITQNLKNDIKKANLLKNITLLGFKDGREKFKLLKSSKILLFPSYYESFGIVALEAQSCAKPVVAYSLPPVKSIFKKGVLFTPIGNTQKFSQQVIKLLTDKFLYQKTTEEARTHAQKFSWQKSSQLVLQSL